MKDKKTTSTTTKQYTQENLVELTDDLVEVNKIIEEAVSEKWSRLQFVSQLANRMLENEKLRVSIAAIAARMLLG